MFRQLLSQESRDRMDWERAELGRLYGLTNSWLAAALLKLARQAQQARPDCRPNDGTYEDRLIWGVVPEVARRLGVVKLTTDEIDWEVREKSDYELRLLGGYCIANIRFTTTPGWALLTRDVVNGNALSLGLDRLCAGRLGDRDDSIVCRLTEIAQVRSRPYSGVWTPELLM